MTWSSTGCRGWSSGPGRSGTRAPRPPPPPRPSPCPPPRSGWHNLQQNTKYKFVSGEIYFLFLLALSWIPDAGQWNDDNMIFYYLIFESYLHISHLIFDIIHPSLPHWDRRRRAVYGKNRFDNSILIHYILLHALSLLLRSELVLKVRWLLGFQGGVFIWPGESPMLYQVTRAAICTHWPARSQYFSDPGYTDTGSRVSPDTIFLLGGGLVQIFGDSDTLALADTQNQSGRVRDISCGKWDINCAVKLKH